MNADAFFDRYKELQAYVGWTPEEGRRVNALASLLEPVLPRLVADFYEEIDRHPDARKVITGGDAQVNRLRGTLLNWLRDLFCGHYDCAYVTRRWRIGFRHVEIGLDQVYTSAALARLRRGLVRYLQEHWQGTTEELHASVAALDTLLDLDAAIIADAYQEEFLDRQKRSERMAEAMSRSESTFRSLVEMAPCLIVLVRHDNTILYINRFAEEVTGYSAREVVGKDAFRILLAPESHAVANENLTRVLSGEVIRGIETPIVCRDGSRRWVLWNAQAILEPAIRDSGTDKEQTQAILAIGQDVTTVKHSQERILQAERLAAIGQMMTGLAHESGNALARSQACLEMLALELQENPEALQLLERTQNAQNHLRQLYDEVRNYAAPIRVEREPWRLDAVWRQAWNNLAVRRQGRDAQLIEESLHLDLTCVVDPFRLEQVFRNIFENALAACTDPVEIRIRCAEIAFASEPAIQVRVRDNGPGLTPEVRARLFEPFFTTKTKGTGLGMAIARRIIEAHGGQIEAAASGPGAEIELVLPRELS
jgi:hypothetical protein